MMSNRGAMFVPVCVDNLVIASRKTCPLVPTRNPSNIPPQKSSTVKNGCTSFFRISVTAIINARTRLAKRAANIDQTDVTGEVKALIARYIGASVWKMEGDIRDVISIGKLVRKSDGPQEIEQIMNTMVKYRQSYLVFEPIYLFLQSIF
jgi:hypothetical protein